MHLQYGFYGYCIILECHRQNNKTIIHFRMKIVYLSILFTYSLMWMYRPWRNELAHHMYIYCKKLNPSQMSCVAKHGLYRNYLVIIHHIQHFSSGGGAEVLSVPSGDGFEAENSIHFLGQSILFHNLLSLHYETFQTEL